MITEGAQTATNVDFEESSFQLYKMRWFILFLYVSSCISNAIHWPQFSIISDVVVNYYGVSYEAVNWTAMVYSLGYIIFILPGNYYINKLGLRVAMVTGMVLTCLAGWLKIVAVAPTRFWLVILSQSIIAVAQVFFVPTPSKVSAVWFGPKEVSSACSVGILGTTIGIAVGFVIPSMIIKTQENVESIEHEFYLMLIPEAIIYTFILVAVIAFFKSKPPTPPSRAQMQIEVKGETSVNGLQSIMKLITNTNYVLLLIGYGLNVGVVYVLSVLLNEIILKFHPTASEDAGRIGLLANIAGMIGALLCGIILDKFKKYRATILTASLFTLVGMISLSIALEKAILFIYIFAIMYGLFSNAMIVVGFEVAVELTYPEPEILSGGLLVAVYQILGILLTYLYSFLLHNVKVLYVNLVMCLLLFISFLLIACIRFELHRQTASLGKEDAGSTIPSTLT